MELQSRKCVANNEVLILAGMDVFAGLDVGYRDPTAFCVIAYDWDEEKYYVLDEYLDAEKTTEQHAAVIQRNGGEVGYRLYLYRFRSSANSI